MYQILSSPKGSVRPCGHCENLVGRWVPGYGFLCEGCTETVAKEKAASESVPACPVCGEEADRIHHAPTAIAPECWFFRCTDCGHEWGHS